MARAGKKRIGTAGDITLGSGNNFDVSIGNVLCGNAKPAEGNVPREEVRPAIRDGEDKISLNFMKTVSRAIVRRESAGRGGRIVTSVEFRPAADCDVAGEIAKDMRKSLGCGSHVEPQKIILQGDIGDRAVSWLNKRGVVKIVRGN
jgi:translation initiation factor 1 (eIF-1/SUI1)